MILLSYRRADSPGFTRALRERLVRELGADRVFLDVETIEAGADFRERLTSAAADADALIVIIGPDWLAPAAGVPNRLHQADDPVRLEIATALRHDVNVVPVLVDGARMPPADSLPPDVRPLADRNAVILGNEHFEADVERLLDVLGAGAARRTRRYTAGLVLALLMAAATVVVLVIVQRAADSPFPLTVRVLEGASGMPISDGQVVMRAGTDVWTRPVDATGNARFEDIPASLRESAAMFSPRVAGFDTTTRTVRLNTEIVSLRLNRVQGPSVVVRGVVLDAERRGLAGVHIDFAGGLATATTDSTGGFTVTVPRSAGTILLVSATREGRVGYLEHVTLPASTLLVLTFQPRETDGANDR